MHTKLNFDWDAWLSFRICKMVTNWEHLVNSSYFITIALNLREKNGFNWLDKNLQSLQSLQNFLRKVYKPKAFVGLLKKSPCIASIIKNWNSILKSNRIFSFLNLIFRNWKKFEWHSISLKSSAERQGVSIINTKMSVCFVFSFIQPKLNLRNLSVSGGGAYFPTEICFI